MTKETGSCFINVKGAWIIHDPENVKIKDWTTFSRKINITLIQKNKRQELLSRKNAYLSPRFRHARGKDLPERSFGGVARHKKHFFGPSEGSQGTKNTFPGLRRGRKAQKTLFRAFGEVARHKKHFFGPSEGSQGTKNIFSGLRRSRKPEERQQNLLTLK